jgi:uncharacterized protein YkwD
MSLLLRPVLTHGAAALAASAAALAFAAEPRDAATTCGLPDFTETALARINDVRARGANCGSGGSFGPAPPVAWSDQLPQAAAAHVRDMVTRNYFSHSSANGRTLADRVGAAGYGWASLAENIAGGYPSIAAVVAGWVKSPSHCRNLMAPNLTQIGLACVPGGEKSTYPNYWTLNMGRPR